MAILKRNLLVLIAFISFTLQGQDTIYLGEFGRDVVPKAEAEFYKIVIKDNIKNDVVHEYQYTLKDTLKSITSYSNYSAKKKERLSHRGFYPDGKIRIEIPFKKEKFDGTLISYWENGS